MYYYGTFSCGHEGRVNITGPLSAREWKKERAFSGLCPDCYKKWLEEKRQLENKEAAEKSQEMELPILIGTEKQVAWANTLRLNIIDKYEKCFKEFQEEIEQKRVYFEESGSTDNEILENAELFVCYECDQIVTSEEELTDAMDYILQNRTDVKFWIDNRNRKDILGLVIMMYREEKQKTVVPDDIRQELVDLRDQLTVIPDVDNKKNGVVELEYEEDGKSLSAKYVKDLNFIDIVKNLNYRWGKSAWVKQITEYTGSIDERAAELGNRLLLAGYTVRFSNELSKNAAVSGTFTPENNRWVKWRGGRLALTWRGRSDSLYNKARKLPSAVWKEGSVRVKIEFYREVEDFAETMGFNIDKESAEKIAAYIKKENQFEHEKVAPVNTARKSDNEQLGMTLESGGTIIADLLDD